MGSSTERTGDIWLSPAISASGHNRDIKIALAVSLAHSTFVFVCSFHIERVEMRRNRLFEEERRVIAHTGKVSSKFDEPQYNMQIKLSTAINPTFYRRQGLAINLIYLLQPLLDNYCTVCVCPVMAAANRY